MFWICYIVIVLHDTIIFLTQRMMTWIYLEESVTIFIEIFAQDLTIRVFAEGYQHSLDTVKMKLNEVLSVLSKLAADIVKPTKGEFTSATLVLVNDERY